MRVLLIEDDSAVAQSIELMLKSESFNVYTTDLGKKASISVNFTITTLFCSTSICLTCRLRRAQAASRVEIKTPILILSGLAGIEDKVKGLGVGADDYMTSLSIRTNWSPASMRSCAAPRATPSR